MDNTHNFLGGLALVVVCLGFSAGLLGTISTRNPVDKALSSLAIIFALMLVSGTVISWSGSEWLITACMGAVVAFLGWAFYRLEVAKSETRRGDIQCKEIWGRYTDLIELKLSPEKRDHAYELANQGNPAELHKFLEIEDALYALRRLGPKP